MTQSAHDIADAVKAGSSTAVDVVSDYLAHAQELNGQLNAFLTFTDDEALEHAADIDRRVQAGEPVGDLAGVPVAIKDNICTRGARTTCASRILQNWIPPYDATVIRRLREADAVVIGKTNLDEFAMGSSTENSAFGPTRNPYDPARVPGGSSGGSAAAVAARLAPLALGSDTGGSIRQPAALCGVVGMKPTYGMVSRYGLVAFASSLDQIGPLATSVRDAALLFDAIGGNDRLDSTSLERPAPRIASALQEGLEACRVGVVLEMLEGAAPDIVTAVRSAADALSSAGAKVEEISMPELAHGLPAYYLIAPAEASSNLARYDGVRYGLRVDADTVEAMNSATRAAGFGPEVKRRIMLGTYALSAGYYDAYYGQAQKVRTIIIEAFNRAFQQSDILLGATTPTTAFAIGDKADNPLEMYLSDVFSVTANLAGVPSMSLPYGTDEKGLPIGVQLLAPALGEASIFQVAAVLESEAPLLPAPGICARRG